MSGEAENEEGRRVGRGKMGKQEKKSNSHSVGDEFSFLTLVFVLKLDFNNGIDSVYFFSLINSSQHLFYILERLIEI